MECKAKKCAGIEVQPKPEILPEIEVMIEEDKQFWNYKDDILPDAEGELPQWKYSSLQMCELFNWLPWGKPSCFRPIQVSSIELMEFIIHKVQDLGEAQVKLVQNVETMQLKKENQPVDGSCCGLCGFQFLTMQLESLNEQAVQVLLIQLTESDNHEILSLGRFEVQVLESSASVSTSSQSGNKTLDCIINAAVDEETSDGFSFLTSMAYAPCKHSGQGYYQHPHGIRGGNYSCQGRGRGPNSYCPAIYEEDYYKIEERLAHHRQCNEYSPPSPPINWHHMLPWPIPSHHHERSGEHHHRHHHPRSETLCVEGV